MCQTSLRGRRHILPKRRKEGRKDSREEDSGCTGQNPLDSESQVSHLTQRRVGDLERAQQTLARAELLQ